MTGLSHTIKEAKDPAGSTAGEDRILRSLRNDREGKNVRDPDRRDHESGKRGASEGELPDGSRSHGGTSGVPGEGSFPAQQRSAGAYYSEQQDRSKGTGRNLPGYRHGDRFCGIGAGGSHRGRRIPGCRTVVVEVCVRGTMDKAAQLAKLATDAASDREPECGQAVPAPGAHGVGAAEWTGYRRRRTGRKYHCTCDEYQVVSDTYRWDAGGGQCLLQRGAPLYRALTGPSFRLSLRFLRSLTAFQSDTPPAQTAQQPEPLAAPSPRLRPPESACGFGLSALFPSPASALPPDDAAPGSVSFPMRSLCS